MKNRDGTQDLSWIDGAFAGGSVDEMEAACCLTEGQNQILSAGNTYPHQMSVDLMNCFKIIHTWNFCRASLLEFIDKAIEMRLPNFRRTLLLEKCREHFLNLSDKEQKRFVEKYFYISRAEKIGFDMESGGESNAQYPWVKPAREIYYELREKHPLLTLDKMAKKIEEEMKRRVKNNDKSCCDRTKNAPRWENIRRHALQNLPK